MKTINVFKLGPDAIIPTRNKQDDAGLDLYSVEDVFIEQLSTKIVKTDIAIQVPVGFVGKIEDRSGLASKGMRNGAGVIDAGYNGMVGVVLHNLTCVKDSIKVTNALGYEDEIFGYQIKKGDKIAQILILPIEVLTPVEVDCIWISDRGADGYGSSGK